MAEYDLGTASGKVTLDFEDRASAAAMAALGRVGAQLQKTTLGMAKSLRQYSSDFVAGFRDSRAALSAFTGTWGTLGGMTRTVVQPLINGVGNFVSGFRDSQAAASAFTGVLGTMGGYVRSAVNPLVAGVGSFASGFTNSQAAASAFSGVLGTLGGVARTVLQPAITQVQNFHSGFTNAGAAASAFSGTMGTVGGAVRNAMDIAVTGVRNFAGNVGPAFSNFASAASATASHVSSVISSAFSAASAAAIAATVALVKSVLATGVNYNSLEQRARMAFKTILGSGDAAIKMMNELADFSRKSPFRREIFIEGAQRLLAFGVETKKVIPTLGALQDAIAAAGGTEADLRGIVLTMAKISSTGKVTGGDLIEFGNRGVNAAELIGRAMGMTAAQFRTYMRTNMVESEFALDALVKGMNDKFGGAAENLKTTWPGAIDRVKGAWRDLSSAIVDPFVNKAGGGFGVAWANTLADAFRVLIPHVQEFFKLVGNKIQPAMEGAARATSAFLKAGDFKGITDSLSKIAPLFGPLVGAIVAFGSAALSNLPLIGKLFPVISGPVGIIAGLLVSLIAISPQLREALGGAFTQIGAAISGAAPLVSGIFETISSLLPPVATLLAVLVTAIAPLIPIFIELAGVIIGALGQVLVAIAPLVGNLAKILGVVLVAAMPILISMTKALVAALEFIIPVVVLIITWIAQLLTTITDTGNITGVWEAVAGFFVGLWNGIVTAATTAWNAVVTAIVTAWTTVSTFITSIMTTIGSYIMNTWTGIVTFFTNLFAPLMPLFDSWLGMMQAWWAFLFALWNVGSAFIGGIIAAIVGVIGAGWAIIANTARAVWTSIWSTITNVWNRISATISALMSVIRSVIQAGWNAIWSFIGPTVMRIYTTVTGAFNDVKTRVSETMTGLFTAVKMIFGQVVSFLAGAKGKVTGAFSGAAGWLVDIGQKIIQGLINGIKSMFDNVKGVLQDLTANLAKWKGPESKDKIILEPVGELVLGSFIDGLKNRIGEVKSTLQGITDMIPRTMQTAVDVAARYQLPGNMLDVAALTTVQPQMAFAASQAGNTGTTDGGTANAFYGDIIVPLDDLAELDAFTTFITEFRRIQRQEGSN